MEQTLESVGEELLFSARNELYMNLPYLDAALCALLFAPGDTLSLATDGETLHYHAPYLADRYLRSPVLVNRAYLHIVLHCMLRHLGKRRGKVAELWDLACDAAVESVLDALDYGCLRTTQAPARRKFYGECQREMKVLTAEGIYRHLLRRNLSEFELGTLRKQFFVDEHDLWERDNATKQDEHWKELSEKTQTAMETVLAGQATGGETVLEQVKAAVRDDIDYRAFLRRFAVPREVVSLDGNAFDPVFYTYGLRLYGNLPLVEPVETREERRIEDFVIAVDTSMSTSGELVREFLACTYAILRSTGTFTRKVNIRILQCDDQIRADTPIHSLDELKTCMEQFQLSGGSATDFRPVFEYVEQLRKEGVFHSLRGLVYFTDGMGVYPSKRPPYETAFVLLDEPPLSVTMPPWAIRLVLTLPSLERAVRQTPELSDDWAEVDAMPEL
ncbi:MAG: hypothetical protein IJR72_03315 [Oscillospiraceae bacterium]|nr:hypothetical protein [Oscillospiraceae bacterium]